MRELIIERACGMRRVAGTEWPVVDRVQREVMPGRRPRWIVTTGLCNGVPEKAVEYSTKRAALAAFGDES